MIGRRGRGELGRRSLHGDGVKQAVLEVANEHVRRPHPVELAVVQRHAALTVLPVQTGPSSREWSRPWSLRTVVQRAVRPDRRRRAARRATPDAGRASSSTPVSRPTPTTVHPPALHEAAIVSWHTVNSHRPIRLNSTVGFSRVAGTGNCLSLVSCYLSDPFDHRQRIGNVMHVKT